MKKENAQNRKALQETNKNYVEVVNDNLSLRREKQALEMLVNQYKERLYGNRKNDLYQLFSEIEPYCYTVDGKPVKTIKYRANKVEIEWFEEHSEVEEQ
jgi:hypothetical protein